MSDLEKLLNPEQGRTGYVALLGRPNTGKSTLVNTLLGCHLAAVSCKPQTTRRQMLGIYNDADSQIIFLDAPGVHAPKVLLDEAMSLSVQRTLEDADLILCLLDPARAPGAEDEMVARLARTSGKPVLLVLNKTDVTTAEQRRESLEFYRRELPDFPVCELTATDLASARALLAVVKEAMPTGVFLYDREEITNAYERDVAADLIREALLEELQQEIPHCIAVTLDTWHESAKGIKIGATLNLEREGHKPIVIGQGGKMIKRLRKVAAAKVAEFCGRKVDLSLFLKVVPNWRKRKQFLKEINLLD